MDLVLDILSWILLIIGAVVSITGGIGMLRLPDVFARMHASGMIDTLGVVAFLLGMALQSGFSLVTVKLGIIMVFILYTSPTATHALAKAALHGGLKPQVKEEGDASSKT